MIERRTPITGAPPAEEADMAFTDLPIASMLAELLHIWRDWPQVDGLPMRAAFDPITIPPALLPWIGLTEFTDHPNDYRGYDVMYRYLGSAMAEAFRIETRTRQHLSDLGPAIAQRWFHVYDHLRESAAPFAIRGIPYLINREYLQFELVVLPLRRDATPASGTDRVGFGLFAMHVSANQDAR